MRHDKSEMHTSQKKEGADEGNSPDLNPIEHCFRFVKVMNMAFKCIFTIISSKPPPRIVKVADLALAAPVVMKRTQTRPIKPSSVTSDPEEFVAAWEALHSCRRILSPRSSPTLGSSLFPS